MLIEDKPSEQSVIQTTEAAAVFLNPDELALLTGFHILLAYWQRGFAAGKFPHTPKFYRIINELPTIMMIAIVLLVVARPF